MVYLTTTYPLYFAHAAAPPGGDMLVVEVADDLDTSHLFPDEDYVAQSMAHYTQSPVIDFHNGVCANLEDFQEHWTASLENMGTVAYRGAIVPDMITRVAVLDPTKMDRSLLWSMLDPSITPLNHMVRGAFYRGFVAWVFGEEDELPHLKEARTSVERFGNKMYEKAVETYTALSAERVGITIKSLA